MARNIGVHILDAIFKVLLLIGLVAVVLCILASYISPETSSFIQFFGLIAPLIICYNGVVSLYWIIRLKLFIIVAIITIILTIFPTLKIYNLEVKYEVAKSNNGLRIVSYNVMHFADRDYNLKENETLAEINKLKPNILCLQEFSATSSNSIENINNKLKNLRYKRILYTQKFRDNIGTGIAIYSQYPIIKYEKIEFNNSYNSAMWVDIKIKSDTIRVFNLHLQTTNVNIEERKMLSTSDILKSLRDKKDMDKLNNIKEKFLKNSVVRAFQAEIINDMIENSPHKVIVCGDFNDTPNSYTYNTVRGDLEDSFIKAGKGYGYTFKDFFSLYRIDYILYDEQLSIYKYTRGESQYSDHYPVIVELNIE